MKAILASIVLFTAFNVFAGPEDHLANQTCYRINAKQTSLVSSNIPQQICLENLSVNNEGTEISVYSYFDASLFKNLKLTYFERRNENGYSFRSEATLFREFDPGCGYSENIILKIKGQTDNDHVADVNYLDITVTQDVTNDTCHSTPQQTIFTYEIY